MEIIKHDQALEIKRFDLNEFVDRIKLTPKVYDHLKRTSISFNEYFLKLSQYDDDFIIYFLIALAHEEINNSRRIEHQTYKDFDLSPKDLFFNKFQISNNKIHKIHEFVMKDVEKNKKIGSYRKTPARVSNIEEDFEEIFFYGAEPEDIKKFMNNFIKIYKSTSNEVIDSNPYLKSSLIHLIFARLQPYFDGNRRTARMLHNIKFTELINKQYNMNLKICPVNLSQSLDVNQVAYFKALNRIYFDLDHDNNDAINYWFNFMLNMYDEQLFVNQNLIKDTDEIVEKISKIKEKFTKQDKRIIQKNKNIR